MTVDDYGLNKEILSSSPLILARDIKHLKEDIVLRYKNMDIEEETAHNTINNTTNYDEKFKILYMLHRLRTTELDIQLANTRSIYDIYEDIISILIKNKNISQDMLNIINDKKLEQKKNDSYDVNINEITKIRKNYVSKAQSEVAELTEQKIQAKLKEEEELAKLTEEERQTKLINEKKAIDEEIQKTDTYINRIKIYQKVSTAATLALTCYGIYLNYLDKDEEQIISGGSVKHSHEYDNIYNLLSTTNPELLDNNGIIKIEEGICSTNQNDAVKNIFNTIREKQEGGKQKPTKTKRKTNRKTNRKNNRKTNRKTNRKNNRKTNRKIQI
jgi:hypothetical protein